MFEQQPWTRRRLHLTGMTVLLCIIPAAIIPAAIYSVRVRAERTRQQEAALLQQQALGAGGTRASYEDDATGATVLLPAVAAGEPCPPGHFRW